MSKLRRERYGNGYERSPNVLDAVHVLKEIDAQSARQRDSNSIPKPIEVLRAQGAAFKEWRKKNKKKPEVGDSN